MTEPTGGELRRCVACGSWMLPDDLQGHHCERVMQQDYHVVEVLYGGVRYIPTHALRALVQQVRGYRERMGIPPSDPDIEREGDTLLMTTYAEGMEWVADALATLLGDTKDA